MTNRNGTTLTWFASNYPKAITKDANNSSVFQYAASRQRWRHVYKSAGTTWTITYIAKMMEKSVTGTTTEFKHFVQTPSGDVVAMLSRKSTGTN